MAARAGTRRRYEPHPPGSVPFKAPEPAAPFATKAAAGLGPDDIDPYLDYSPPSSRQERRGSRVGNMLRSFRGSTPSLPVPAESARRGSAPDFSRISRAIADSASASLRSGRRGRRSRHQSHYASDARSARTDPDAWSDSHYPVPDLSLAPPFAPSRSPSTRSRASSRSGISGRSQTTARTPPPSSVRQLASPKSDRAPPAARKVVSPVSPKQITPALYSDSDSDAGSSDEFFDAESEVPAPSAYPALNSDEAPQHPLQRSSARVPRCNGLGPTASTAMSSASVHRPSVSTVPTSGSDTAELKMDKKYVAAKAAATAQLSTADVLQSDAELREDVEVARMAVEQFLNSEMLAAEELMKTKGNTRLYYALGASLIQVFKAFMTFDHDDLLAAVSFSKDAMHIASLLRQPSSTVASLGRFVRGSGMSPTSMHSMTMVQRHAELVYAESTFLKAVMGILVSGDILGFVTEALSMRNAYGIYRSLAKYLDWVDAEVAKGNTSVAAEIDEDFRSGVALGTGLINMCLGLLPSKVLTLMTCFGYTGNCAEGLRILMEPGGWVKNVSAPATPKAREGIRRPLCDMGILLYHLVIATFMPVQGVDVDTASHILAYHLDRYPKGVFILYFSGRLHSTQVDPEPAIAQFARARDVQSQYRQIRHICIWDMGLCSMSLGDWALAAGCYKTLLDESNWSKAVYMWGVGSNMYQHLQVAKAQGLSPAEAASDWGREGEPSVFVKADADPQAAARHALQLMMEAPKHMQRIAGKSIPLEKFVQKKAAKLKIHGYLLLPAMEFSYVYHCISHAPGSALASVHLPLIQSELRKIQAAATPESYPAGPNAYWDDFCLAHFLHGTVNKHVAYPEEHAVHSPPSPSRRAKADRAAEESLVLVTANAQKLSSDHYLAYFAQYELGRLYAARGEVEKARQAFQTVMSGKQLDSGRKGKYAMQNMCLLRTNGALGMLPPA